MTQAFQCYRCGESLDHLMQPWSRRDQCGRCSNDVHVCRMCEYFDASVPRECREDGADDVKEKDRVNFCDWFKPSRSAFNPEVEQAALRAEQELENLFGASTPSEDQEKPLSDAEKLFRD